MPLYPGAASLPSLMETQSAGHEGQDFDLRPSCESQKDAASVGQGDTGRSDSSPVAGLSHTSVMCVCLWASWSWVCGHSGATENPAACLGLLQLCVGRRSVATSLCLQDYPLDLSH